MLEWYTSLLTDGQLLAVWIVSFIVVTIIAWIGGHLEMPGDPDNFGMAASIGAFIFPAIWSIVWLLFALIDLIGWLWAH